MKIVSTIINEFNTRIEYHFRNGFIIIVRTYSGSDLYGYEFKGCLDLKRWTEVDKWIQDNQEKIKGDLQWKN